MLYFYLILAIILEVIGTSALKLTEGFTRFWPSVLSLASYGFAFYLLSLTLKTMPVGVVYAVWSGTGIVLVALIGLFAFGQRLDLPAVLGLALIIAGVLIVNLFSRSVGH